MTVKDLRTLVDNLDEYIHVPGGIERLKKTILHLAISGQLVPQDPSEGTGEELYQQIQAEKQKLIVDGKLKKQKLLPEIADGEIPFVIPRTWKWAKLDEISLVVTDGDHQPPPKSESGVPFLVIGDVRNGNLDTTRASRKVSQAYYDKLDWAHKPKQGDVLYTTVGSYGIPVPVNEQSPFCFQRHIGLIRPGVSELSDFLFVYLNSSFVLSQAAHYATGIAQKTVPISGMRNFIVGLPPLLEQKRIVGKVEMIFKLIDQLAEKYKAEQDERTKLVISSLSMLSKGQSTLALGMLTEIVKSKEDAVELRKTILHLAVSGQLVPQDLSEGTGEELYQQIQAGKAKLVREGKLKKQKPLPEITQEEIPFEIPNSWKWSMLGEIGRIMGGGTPPSSKSEYYTEDFNVGIPWLTPADLRGYKDVFISHGKRNITETGLKSSSAQIMPKNTVLFSSRAPIGHIAIAKNEITTNQGFKSVAPYPGLNSEYIYRWLQFYGPTIDANASGTTFREVSGTIVARQLVPLAPQAEQTRIVQKTTQLLDLLAKLESRLGQ